MTANVIAAGGSKKKRLLISPEPLCRRGGSEAGSEGGREGGRRQGGRGAIEKHQLLFHIKGLDTTEMTNTFVGPEM